MKKRKLFFPSGLISLVLLPIICLIYIYQNNGFKNENILSLYFWNLNMSDQYKQSFNSYIQRKKYEHYFLTKNEQKNIAIFNLAEKSIKKLVNSRDTIHGIHFSIDDNTEFKTFIDVINLCKVENVKVYIPNENDIWIMNPMLKETKKEELHYCNPNLGNSTVIDQVSAQKVKTVRNYINEISTMFWSSIFFFLILVSLNIKKNMLIFKSFKHKQITM